MTIHRNARLTPAARRLLVHRVRSQGWLVKEAAGAAGVSRRTAHKWLRRFEEVSGQPSAFFPCRSTGCRPDAIQ